MARKLETSSKNPPSNGTGKRQHGSSPLWQVVLHRLSSAVYGALRLFTRRKEVQYAIEYTVASRCKRGGKLLRTLCVTDLKSTTRRSELYRSIFKISSKNLQQKLELSFLAILSSILLYTLFHSLSLVLLDLSTSHHPNSIFMQPPLLLAKNFLLYASVYLLVGSLLYYKILPLPNKSLCLQKKNVSKQSAILWGLLAGILALALVKLSLYMLPTADWNVRQQSLARPSERMLQKESLYLLWHLLFTGILTALTEEIFYRGFLQNYLEKNIGTFPSIFIASLNFALVHPDIWAILLIPSAIFGILFSQQGLLSAIVAHTSYNSLILILVTSGYS